MNNQQLLSDSTSGNQDHFTDTPATSSFGAGLPPVPSRLIKRIQEGNFIDMSELTIDHLTMSPLDETGKSPTPKRHPVTSIIEWTQCFANYIAILVQAQPERISDLLGYQHLILEGSLEYSGDGWAVYDHRFRQIVATHAGIIWASVPPTLQNSVVWL